MKRETNSKRLRVACAPGVLAPAGGCDGLRETLVARGHTVVSFDAEEQDVLSISCDAWIASGQPGFALLDELRSSADSTPVIHLTERFAQAHARGSGSSEDLDPKTNPIAVVFAVEECVAEREARRSAFGRTEQADERCVGRIARELAAQLLLNGVGPGHRVRIASATAELIDNVARHAYEPDRIERPVRVEARCTGAEVHVTVRDWGRGLMAAPDVLEPALPARDESPRTARSGLDRARALSEELVFATCEEGTSARLSFRLTPAVFEEDGADLFEADFLLPEETRRLLDAVQLGETLAPVAIPDSLSLALGRLLSDAQGPRGAFVEGAWS